MFEQHVVHLPEEALRAGGLDGLGGERRVRMHADDGEVAEADDELIAERPLERPHDGIRLPAERALEVAELDELQRRVEVAAQMVGFAQRRSQAHGCTWPRKW